jgi:hypothetical protein
MNSKDSLHALNALNSLLLALRRRLFLPCKHQRLYTRFILRNLNPPQESPFKLRRIAKLSVLKPLLLSPKLLSLQITTAQKHKARKEITPHLGFCGPLRQPRLLLCAMSELNGLLSGSACFNLLFAEKSISSITENMPKYIIEREIAGAGTLNPEQLQSISQKSCGVLKKLGPQIQWLESYVTDDKVYCVYIAPDEATVREHAKQGGFPANRVSEVKGIIDPTTAEGPLTNTL